MQIVFLLQQVSRGHLRSLKTATVKIAVSKLRKRKLVIFGAELSAPKMTSTAARSMMQSRVECRKQEILFSAILGAVGDRPFPVEVFGERIEIKLYEIEWGHLIAVDVTRRSVMQVSATKSFVAK